MSTCRFETGVTVAFTEAQDPEAGTVTLLGMATRGEYALDERGSGGAALLGPPSEAHRRPLTELPVALGHMRVECGVTAWVV